MSRPGVDGGADPPGPSSPIEEIDRALAALGVDVAALAREGVGPSRGDGAGPSSGNGIVDDLIEYGWPGSDDQTYLSSNAGNAIFLAAYPEDWYHKVFD